MGGFLGIRAGLFEAVALLCIMVAVATALIPADFSLPLPMLLGGVGLAAILLSVPYVIIYFLTRHLKKTIMRLASLGLMLGILGMWVWFWYSTFINNPAPDAQNGLIFVVGPVYAIIASILISLVFRMTDNFKIEPRRK
ncbi:MAG: hypothetical protein KDJ73_05410 [Notoacmeibacter sp.]|nr:hypothetical protein [Notoacmeibacter sp.]